MAHNGACENAKRHQCRCGGCGGAQHGWRGHLVLAASESPHTRDSRRTEAERVWSAAFQSGKGRSTWPTQKARAAAVDTAVADIVDWLTVNRKSAHNLENVGDIIAGPVCATAAAEFESSLATTGSRIAGETPMHSLTRHFWCELLAELARASAAVRSGLDRVPEHAVSALLATGGHPDWVESHRSIAETVVHAIWRPVCGLALAENLEALTQTLRLLALLICPAPEGHPGLLSNCLSPLAKDILSAATEHRLGEAFPEVPGPPPAA